MPMIAMRVKSDSTTSRMTPRRRWLLRYRASNMVVPLAWRCPKPARCPPRGRRLGPRPFLFPSRGPLRAPPLHVLDDGHLARRLRPGVPDAHRDLDGPHGDEAPVGVLVQGDAGVGVG